MSLSLPMRNRWKSRAPAGVSRSDRVCTAASISRCNVVSASCPRQPSGARSGSPRSLACRAGNSPNSDAPERLPRARWLRQRRPARGPAARCAGRRARGGLPGWTEQVGMLLADLAQDRLELFRTVSSGLTTAATSCGVKPDLPRVRVTGAVPDVLERGEQLLIRRHRLGKRRCGPRAGDASRPLHARRQYPGAVRPTIHRRGCDTMRLRDMLRYPRVLFPEASSTALFARSSSLRVRHDVRDLPLLGDQEPLKLPRAQRGVDGKRSRCTTARSISSAIASSRLTLSRVAA